MPAYKTAIKRTRPSAPMQRLAAAGQLTGRVLDYGSGKGFDADHFGLHRYDPYYSPEMPIGQFGTITCNFVLNVIEDAAERRAVLEDIQSRLLLRGAAFITVRNDKKELNGKTRIGTWQGLIELNLPIVQSGSGFTTYLLRNTDDIDSIVGEVS